MLEKEDPPPSTDDVIQLLFDLAPHTRISKHVSGKITIKFRPSGLRVFWNPNIRNLNPAIPGIRKAKTSLWTRSVDIEYDENQIPSNIWENLFRCDHNPEQQKILRDRLREIL